MLSMRRQESPYNSHFLPDPLLQLLSVTVNKQMECPDEAKLDSSS